MENCSCSIPGTSLSGQVNQMNHHEACEVVVEKQVSVIHAIDSGYDFLAPGYLVLTLLPGPPDPPRKHGMSKQNFGLKLSIYMNTSVPAF